MIRKVSNVNEVNCMSKANYPYYPTQLLLDLDRIVMQNNGNFCNFLSKRIGCEVDEFYGLYFGYLEIRCCVTLCDEQELIMYIPVEDFEQWLVEVNNE